MSRRDDRDDAHRQPAWPLGCALAFFALLLIFNLLGLAGIVFASGRLPMWAERGGPILLATAVLALMLWGGVYVRHRNPYASRVLLWGLGLTLAFGAALTILFNLIDWLSMR
ncbi:MAG: hypothetical protein HGA45_25675 [Chloroflexales bacterium]|nr:hypothetical protein [Chloroflexales bacterium]